MRKSLSTKLGDNGAATADDEEEEDADADDDAAR